ncbi:SGNH/GDSL hydrolase family protein [Streptomyces sp. PTM05]|uniref:SGNH/GDSL hydrolase family protein n=1 Tax=Streptantibioticus parmotrematis TaxID=2873249 RepID=A0ABS7QY78_9ACTN|nr:SGNH/GDSL hydrolase family protein [Streptantibioticus parmotrematis]MBY8887656.1 SGNH/GDSL hydrolase family protein [Streptantibioticus parmotrematis]
MRRSALLAAAVSLAAGAAITLGGAPAQASGVNYVALGDSYSAGVGSTSDYLNSCDQSTAAYPYLYSKAAGVSSFSFEACTGATAPDIESSQMGPLNSGTTLVSLTDGGNDVGFSDVMETCVLDSTSTCQSAVAGAENEAKTQLPAILDTLYSDIRSKAPNAHVVVIGYPEFYDLSKTSCVGLSQADHTALDQGSDTLDSVIAAEVAKYSNFTFEDVRGAFSGHELCDSSEWLHSVTWPISDSYHPTASGQSGAYLPVFESGV